MEEATEMFELAAEEIQVCLRLRGPAGRHELRHILRPPRWEDWRDYERSLRSTVETVENDGQEAMRFDSRAMEAAAELYDRLFRSAEGYHGNQNGCVTAEMIPLPHKEMVVRGLGDVAPATEEETAGEPGAESLFSLDADTVEVALQATRSGKKFRNLAHVFRAPTAADHVEYSRISAQALYVRGSKTLKSILPPRLPGLVALYDRLIQQVRGYGVAGQPLGERAAIVQHMDPLHKKAAVQTLFEE